jgi:hypothetical protein
VTAVAPGIDRGGDRRDAPHEPERPEPDTTPRDARWAALLDGLPDAFIEPDATPESIAELRRRLGMPAVGWPEQPPRAEPADADRVARRLRELEAEGHGPQRHEGQVTDQQLRGRVLHGHDPAQQGPDKTIDAVTGGRHERPRIASRFDTPEAMVTADDALRASDAFARTAELAQARGRESMWIRLPLANALQPELRAQVTGVERIGTGEHPAVRPVDFSDGWIQAGFHWDDSNETWKTYTIYPDRPRQTDREGAW